MDTLPTPKGISERNRQLLATLHRKARGPFTVREAANLLSLSIGRTQRFLAYLAARGWLVRTRRGLYATVPLNAVEPAHWREDPWIVASKVFSPSSYIAGWSACEHWELTEQIFREIVVVTTRRLSGASIKSRPLLVAVRRPSVGGVGGVAADPRRKDGDARSSRLSRPGLPGRPPPRSRSAVP